MVELEKSMKQKPNFDQNDEVNSIEVTLFEYKGVDENSRDGRNRENIK